MERRRGLQGGSFENVVEMVKVVCSHCGCETDNYCIIEKGPPGENWIEDIWVKLGYGGKPVCAECYYK